MNIESESLKEAHKGTVQNQSLDDSHDTRPDPKARKAGINLIVGPKNRSDEDSNRSIEQ